VSVQSSSVEAAKATPPTKKGNSLGSLATNQLTILLVVFVALFFYFGSQNARFFRTGEISSLVVDFSGLVLLAIAETYVIVSGGIDLSVGSTVAISGVLGAEVMNHYQGHMGQVPLLLLGTLICALVGLVVGTINAFLITVVNMVPFVATLITLSAGAGYALVVSGGGDVGNIQSAIIWSSTGWWIFTWLSLIVLVIATVMCIVLHFTRYGRYTFATGSNDFAARAAGINIKRHIASIYVLSGLLSGLVGMFWFIRIGAGSPTTDATANLEAIACVVIGGVSLTGGMGSVVGALLGCAILTIVTDGLVFINVPPTWNQVVVGAIIAIAAALQALRGTRSRR
jgi:ribose transport system permease protein